MTKLYIVISLFLYVNIGILAQTITVTTLAGSGVASNIDGIGSSATLYHPYHVASDADGNIYTTDKHIIRKISPSGVVNTFAGNDNPGSTDDIGTSASFNSPTGIAIDVNGYIFVADYGNNKIRKISPSGTVSTFAGSGLTGHDDGSGTTASFNHPEGICVDLVGNLYVTDRDNNRIRKISPTGLVTTIAGDGTIGSADGSALTSSFFYPGGIAVDSEGNLYVSDTNNNKIRKISSTGNVSSFCGDATAGDVDGNGTTARFSHPRQLAFDATGNLIVTDAVNNKIRKITPTAEVSTLAGIHSFGSTDGSVDTASFFGPRGVTIDRDGNIYVADFQNNKIRKIERSTVTNNLTSTFEDSFSSYPNPTHGIINIGLDGEKHIVITDLAGNVCYEETITQQTLNLSFLPKGMYLFAISQDNKKYRSKILVE